MGGERRVSKGAHLLRLVTRHWWPAPITVEAGASMVGVEVCTFWRWLDGRNVPGPEQLLKLKETFGIAPEAWFSE